MKRYNVEITPSRLSGSIEAIPSKSYAHRILLSAALADRPTEVRIPRLSKDILATIEAIKGLGCSVKQNKLGDVFTVTPICRTSLPDECLIHCSESGTTSRLILPIAAAIYDKATVSGEGSLLSRPFDELCRVMEEHGASLSSDRLPITAKGRLKSGDYRIKGNVSSQYISALLMALPLLPEKSRIVLTEPLSSAGYVDMTRKVLSTFGVNIEPSLEIEPQRYVSPGYVEVEGDASNAAFFLAAGVKVTGIPEDTLQRDAVFSSVCDKSVIDIDQFPDLAPILAVYACMKTGRTEICGIERLRIKESDRVESIRALITSLGGEVEVLDNSIVITGTGRLSGGTVNSFNDHRIVMAAAIASTVCDGTVTVVGAEAVEKSYPEFFEDFNRLGGHANVKFVR